MEYEIDNEIKYTTLYIRSMLFWKGVHKKKQKKTPTQIPPGGWGMGSKEPIKKLFLLTVVKISYK